MAASFAEYFRTLRNAKRLSRAELARRAGIAVRTMGYWEAEERLPRIPELEAALTALGADEDERLQAFSHIGAPRGMQQARLVAPPGSVLADTGDLLRAMRMRRRLTQEVMAAELGLQRSAVRRWEMGECLPTAENLERAFTLLGALPEEQQALRTGQLQTPGQKACLTLEECEAAAARLLPGSLDFQSPLIDLQALALKRRLRLLGAHSNAARSLLAQVERDHCIWLGTQEREPEANECLKRALNLMEAAGRPESHWASVLNLAGIAFRDDMAQRGINSRFLQKWLSGEKSGITRVKLLSDGALYAAQSRNFAAASALMKEAERHCKGRQESEAYWRLTAMRVQMHGEMSEDALRWLLENITGLYFQTSYLLEWTRLLLSRNEKQSAVRWLGEIETRYPFQAFPLRQKSFDALARQV